MKIILMIILMTVSIAAFPYFNEIPNPTGEEGEFVEFDISAWSEYGYPLVFQCQCSLTDYALINLGKIGGCTCSKTEWAARFSYYADYTSAGIHEIIFTAVDTIKQRTCSDTIYLEITDALIPPKITAINDTFLYEHDTLKLHIHYSDEDTPDSLFNLVFQTKKLKYLFQNDTLSLFQDGYGYGEDSLIITVTDQSGLSVSDTSSINIINVNDPPFLQVSSSIELNDNEIFSIDLKDIASDPDHSFQDLSWQIYSTSNLFSRNNDSIIIFFPESSSIYKDTIHWIVNDPLNLTDSAQTEIIFISANPINENQTKLNSEEFPYPNPFYDKTNIKFSNPFTGTINIYNVMGKLVDSKNIHSCTFIQWPFQTTKEKLSSGVYFISLNSSAISRRYKVTWLK